MQIRKIRKRTVHADCYNFNVFGLFEFLHRWLSECSCTCAGGFNLLAESINETFEARSNVRILCHRAKSDPSFLTE